MPYVGAGVLASAAGMDKEFTKKLLAAEGLPIGDQVVLRPRDETLELEDRERLGLPVFVKPARGGSSIGVSRVVAWDQLPSAIELARRHDPKVIVEAAVVGSRTRMRCPRIPGRLSRSQHRRRRSGWPGCGAARTRSTTSPPSTSTTRPNSTSPPRSTTRSPTPCAQLAIRAFRAIDCQGLARVDFFLTDDGPVINEINTMPGFTTISMYPRMWAASGVDYPTLLATMVDTALARGTGLR